MKSFAFLTYLYQHIIARLDYKQYFYRHKCGGSHQSPPQRRDLRCGKGVRYRVHLEFTSRLNVRSAGSRRRWSGLSSCCVFVLWMWVYGPRIPSNGNASSSNMKPFLPPSRLQIITLSSRWDDEPAPGVGVRETDMIACPPLRSVASQAPCATHRQQIDGAVVKLYVPITSNQI